MTEARAYELMQVVQAAMEFLTPPMNAETHRTLELLRAIRPKLEHILQWYSNTVPIMGKMREQILANLEFQSQMVEDYFADNAGVSENASEAPGDGSRTDSRVATSIVGEEV